MCERVRVLAPTYPISTDRLLLRPLTAEDVDDVLAYQSLPEVCRYVPAQPRNREQVVQWLEGASARDRLTEPGQALSLGVQLLDGQLVGDVMIHWGSAEHRNGEIGYVFNPAYAGRGYATEATRALLELGFEGLGLHRITARTDARNVPSHRVLRRLGMRPEAYLVENEWFKGEWSDEIDFAILRREWRRG